MIQQRWNWCFNIIKCFTPNINSHHFSYFITRCHIKTDKMVEIMRHSGGKWKWNIPTVEKMVWFFSCLTDFFLWCDSIVGEVSGVTGNAWMQHLGSMTFKHLGKPARRRLVLDQKYGSRSSLTCHEAGWKVRGSVCFMAICQMLLRSLDQSVGWTNNKMSEIIVFNVSYQFELLSVLLRSQLDSVTWLLIFASIFYF